MPAGPWRARRTRDWIAVTAAGGWREEGVVHASRGLPPPERGVYRDKAHNHWRFWGCMGAQAGSGAFTGGHLGARVCRCVHECARVCMGVHGLSGG